MAKINVSCSIRAEVAEIAKRMRINKSKILEERLLEIIGPENFEYQLMQINKEKYETSEASFKKTAMSKMV